MTQNTPHADLYKWDVKDSKLKTFTEFANNADKIDTELSGHETLLTDHTTQLSGHTNSINEHTTQLAETTQDVGDLSLVWDRPLSKSVSDRGINVKYFGAVGDGVTDDTTAFENAIAYCKTNPFNKYLPLFIPIGTYKTTRPLKMHNGMGWYGEGSKDAEFEKRTILVNSLTDMFSFDGNHKTDVFFTGIQFKGNSTLRNTNFIEAQDTGTGWILQYSAIFNCGFNYFNYLMNGRILGCHIYENYINNGLHILRLAGSDSIIENNFMGLMADNDANFYACELIAIGLTRFTNNYITGRKSKALKLDNCNCLIIDKNWFDYTDQSGLYINNSKRCVFRDNYFRQNVIVPSGFFSAVIVVFDSNNLLFTGNQFDNEPAGYKAYSFRKSTTGCDRITVRDNFYGTNDALVIETNGGELAFITNILIDEPYTQYNSGTLRPNFSPIGKPYFDTTLGKIIYYKGSNVWVDAVGTTV